MGRARDPAIGNREGQRCTASFGDRVSRSDVEVRWQAGTVFERFSDRSRRVLVHAQNETRLLDDRHIGSEHPLLGLLHDADGLAVRALLSLGVSLDEARTRAAPACRQAGELHLAFTPSAKRTLERAHQVRLATREATVTTKDLLLGLLDVSDASSSRLLGSFGATPRTFGQPSMRCPTKSETVSLSDRQRPST